MRPLKLKPDPPRRERVPVTDEELREVERSTVLLAELTASRIGDTAANVLGTAFDLAAVSGRTPFELLRDRRWVKGGNRES